MELGGDCWLSFVDCSEALQLFPSTVRLVEDWHEVLLFKKMQGETWELVSSAKVPLYMAISIKNVVI